MNGERNDAIAAAWMGGRTGPDIAHEYRITRQRVHQVIRAAGVVRAHHPHPRPRRAKTLQMAAAYAAGEPVDDIAARFATTYKAVLIAARRCGMPYRRACYSGRATSYR